MHTQNIEDLIEENAKLKILNSIFEKQTLSLKEENDRLQNLVLQFKREIFGSKSERVSIPVDQLHLAFDELEVLAGQLGEDGKESEVLEHVAGHSRSKKGVRSKMLFPKGLEREEMIVDLPESEKNCPHDGSTLNFIGYETAERLKCYPARLVVVEEKRKKYACNECSSHMAQAAAPLSVLPKTIATSELLSFLIFSKFFQALPIYRIEELFLMYGLKLTRGRMARWLIQTSEKLVPVWNILQDRVLASGYMCIDATSVQVLKEENRPAKSKSFMWARGSPELGIVLFDYDPGGGGAVAQKLVQDFVGGLQSDAHGGYDALDAKNIIRLGCMMHVRRKFEKAYVSGKQMPGIALEGLRRIRKIYEIEEGYKASGASFENRYNDRLKTLKPMLEDMKTWAMEKVEIVPSKSPVSIALRYFIREYNELTGFFENGRYEVDNGWVERAIRKFAIGRKNWMFCDSVAGAGASSLLYSLVITAKLNSRDPYKVMVEVLNKIPHATTGEDFEAIADLIAGPRAVKQYCASYDSKNTIH